MDDLDPIRRLGASVPTEDQAARERARERLRAHVDAQEQPSRSGPWRRRRRWLGLAAAAAIVLLVVLFLLPGSPPRSAATSLDDLARTASGQGLVQIPPGKYLYVATEDFGPVAGEDLATGKSWTALVRVTRQSWRGADGSGRILTTAGPPRFLSPEDEKAWRDAGMPPLVPRSDERYKPGTFPSTPLTRFPLDPDALRGMLDRRQGLVGPPGNAGTLSIIGTLLAQQEASPKLRAALVRVAASLPGIQVVGRAHDPLHRPSLALGLTANGYRTVLHFDPKTSALLAKVQSKPAGDSGTNTQWTAYHRPVLVDSLLSVPRPPPA